MTIHAPKITLAALCILLFPAALAAQTTWYVDDDAPLGGDGLSWNTAYQYLQDALISASAGDEIRVAGGTYNPDMDEAGNVTPGDRTATFQLKSGVALYGGYAGLADPGNPDARDIDTNGSILSGDIDPNGAAGDSYHVVTASGTDNSAVVNGLRIYNGNATGTTPHDVGGGVYNSGGSATFVDCQIRYNTSSQQGGGVYNTAGAQATFTNCRLTTNTSYGNGGGIANDGASPVLTACVVKNVAFMNGGGMLNTGGSAPQVTGCTFSQNQALGDGGAVYNQASAPVFRACSFEDSQGENNGAAVYNKSGSDAVFEDCQFDGTGQNVAPKGGLVYNTASDPTFARCSFSASLAYDGGAMYNAANAAPSLTDCDFDSNLAYSRGGAVYCVDAQPMFKRCTFTNNEQEFWYGSLPGGGAVYLDQSEASFTDCSFHDNTAEEYGGGAVRSIDSIAYYTGCTFVKNRVSIDSYGPAIFNMGGAVYADRCFFAGNRASFDFTAGSGAVELQESTHAVFTSCVFSANVASYSGQGGAACITSSHATFTNCSFSRNRAELAGAIWAYGASAVLTNCVVWDNLSEYGSDMYNTTVAHSCVGGGWPGVDNINENPLFIDIDGPDDIIGTADDDLRLQVGSPAIDAGTNDADIDAYSSGHQPLPPSDLDDKGRIVDGNTDGHAVVDMGAYEYQFDCNGNGVDDLQDIAGGTSSDCNANNTPDECENNDDCNLNGVPDVCDIHAGTSGDCNRNFVPDECDVSNGTVSDCNNNGVPDQCDISAGTSSDCNGTGILDECELAAGTSLDCNANSVLDECDITGVTSNDCNGSTIPDECELVAGTSRDCNVNEIPDSCDIALGASNDCNATRVPDECEIAAGTSNDCNNDAIPDECQPNFDCNSNGVLDICDVGGGTSDDCNANFVPDECELAEGEATDCNLNGSLDECDIAQGTSVDCNATGLPDECEIAAGTSFDCNANSVPDECDLALGVSQDCNDNGTPDECDVAAGTSHDCNADGWLDECTAAGPLSGFALNFDLGSDHVRIPSSPSLRPENDFTVEAWVNVRSFGDNQFVVEHETNGGGNDGYYLLIAPSGQARFGARNSNGGTAQSIFSTQYLDLDHWHHIAGSYDNSTLNVYVDGQQTSKSASDDVIYEVLNYIHIGQQGETATKHVDGLIDEVRIWNVVRQPEEIQSAMYHTLIGDEPGLVGYWRFDEGAGTVAIDSAGDQDGILIDDPQWESIAADCNASSIPDECEIAAGTSQDCNGDAIPDECQPSDDCNSNGAPDMCDLFTGTSDDCNDNDIPDECEIAAGSSTDCNDNNVLDQCDLAGGTGADCNDNGVPDECDVVQGTSSDCNDNSRPDECEFTDNELIVNGSFAAGLDYWQNNSTTDFGQPFVAGVSIVDDSPHVATLKLSALPATNYTIRIDQEVAVNGLDTPFQYSFDWKVTEKDPGGGVQYVLLEFHDSAGVPLGRVIYVDAGSAYYTLEYFRTWTSGTGEVTLDAFYGQRRFQETFDWQHSSVTSDDLPGLDVQQVASIWIRILLQDQFGASGEMLVDNVSLIVPSTGDCNANSVFDYCEELTFGDYTGNGAVDLLDHTAFLSCLAGPDAPPANTTCASLCLAAFDCDADDDVDLFDFACLTTAFDTEP